MEWMDGMRIIVDWTDRLHKMASRTREIPYSSPLSILPANYSLLSATFVLFWMQLNPAITHPPVKETAYNISYDIFSLRSALPVTTRVRHRF